MVATKLTKAQKEFLKGFARGSLCDRETFDNAIFYWNVSLEFIRGMKAARLAWDAFERNPPNNQWIPLKVFQGKHLTVIEYLAPENPF